MPPTAPEGPVIEFHDVSYRVASTDVLCGLNLRVQRGETLVLLGRSGSGKTTTLKLVNRLLSPTAGEVRVNGVPNRDADVIRLRRSIGYVIQDVGLFPHFTANRDSAATNSAAASHLQVIADDIPLNQRTAKADSYPRTIAGIVRADRVIGNGGRRIAHRDAATLAVIWSLKAGGAVADCNPLRTELAVSPEMNNTSVPRPPPLIVVKDAPWTLLTVMAFPLKLMFSCRCHPRPRRCLRC